MMGILNVTPDSFSDGGMHFDGLAAVDAGFQMVDEGADVIDVGGESTRPNAEPVAADEELRRVVPVVKALAARGLRVSIDTSKAAVARACLEAGAWMVNDVTAFSDVEMPVVCAEAGCHVCLMHMKGTPRSMQVDPAYDDVVVEVKSYLVARAAAAESSGIARSRLWIDPGIGFGKTVAHNLELLRHLSALVETGFPVLIGVSRKSFLSRLGDGAALGVDERLSATIAAQTIVQACGVKAIRAHDVTAARQAIDATAAILGVPDGTLRL